MQNFKSNTGTVIESLQICANYVYLYLTHYVIFSLIVLHAVIFLCDFHLDVIIRQIELKLKVKTEISLSTAIMLNHPCTTVLCDYYSV